MRLGGGCFDDNSEIVKKNFDGEMPFSPWWALFSGSFISHSIVLVSGNDVQY